LRKKRSGGVTGVTSNIKKPGQIQACAKGSANILRDQQIVWSERLYRVTREARKTRGGSC